MSKLQLKYRIGKFFDNDSTEYLEHKYVTNSLSYMALRKEKARGIIEDLLIPSLGERFLFLDCGCGPGILLDILAKHQVYYFGLDISEEMLKLARNQPEGFVGNLGQKSLVKGDVEHLPFQTDSFDAAASLGVIEYLEGDDRLLAEMSRIIRPNGYLLIAVTNKYSFNLLLEKQLNWLRRNKVALRVLNRVKTGLKLGQFKQMDFEKRRHSPRQFIKNLELHSFTVIHSVSWGFNVLPHPLHHVCKSDWNLFANTTFDRAGSNRVKALGEGFMFLCRSKKEGSKGEGQDRS